MARVVKQEMVLVGPHEGKTIELAGFSFTNGVCVLTGSADQLEGPMNILMQFNSAYPKGSEEYQKAAERYAKNSKPKASEAPGAAPKLEEMSNAQLKDMAKERWGKDIEGNKLQLIQQVKELLASGDKE